MQQKNIPIITRWKTAASTLKKETYALFLAAKHPDTPWYAKLFAGVIVAYAFSPIDLIPDFIPVLGCLDDLILLPLGVLLARKMIPQAVLEECRAQAETRFAGHQPTNWIVGALIIMLWILLATFVLRWGYREFIQPSS